MAVDQSNNDLDQPIPFSEDHGAAYEAIRGDWRISQKYRGAEDYAIGLEAGISRIVVKIKKWSETGIRDDSKQSFEGSAIHDEDVGHQLFEKDFSSIVKNDGLLETRKSNQSLFSVIQQSRNRSGFEGRWYHRLGLTESKTTARDHAEVM